MRKKLLAFTAVAALGVGSAFGVAACGSDDNDGTTVEEVVTEAAPTETAATLTAPTTTTPTQTDTTNTQTTDTEAGGGLD